jgi:hypothetical protein
VSTNPIAERHTRHREETAKAGAEIFKRFNPYLSRQKKLKAIHKARLGKAVTTYRAVYDLARAKGSVAVPGYGEILPAAWILGMQYAAASQRMESGMFVYRKAVAK